MHLAPNKISILFLPLSLSLFLSLPLSPSLSAAAFQFMLIRWPVQYASYMQMSRLHVPPIFRLWQLPAPPWPPAPAPAPAPTSASINRRAYYTMQCVPGSMEESPLSIPHPPLCIPYREHAATFLASSRCVCICPTVRQTGAQNFLCCICPVAAHS